MNKQSLGPLLRFLLPLLLTLAGAVGGYLYYRFVGCATGTCAITSNPYISTVYGAVMGLLIGIIASHGARKSGE